MNRIALFVIAIAGAAIFVQAQPENKNVDPGPSGELAQVREAIDKGNAQWIEAWDKADASLIAQLFAPDGVILRRNGQVSKGPQQVLEHMKPILESAGKGVKATITTASIWIDNDTAYETGKYSYTFREKGKPVTDEGRYVTIWKLQSDRSWKIVVDMGVPKN